MLPLLVLFPFIITTTHQVSEKGPVYQIRVMEQRIKYCLEKNSKAVCDDIFSPESTIQFADRNISGTDEINSYLYGLMSRVGNFELVNHLITSASDDNFQANGTMVQSNQNCTEISDYLAKFESMKKGYKLSFLKVFGIQSGDKECKCIICPQ
ncbi:unnamed protein product [Caenorhabditis auriculariae]|uniref:Uncharacterized protein n=1 Tax=Caenorhabditis auriculariae TaxID=2777116 RepID=A0A8S1GW71_9PELO|nr:unnamed protein product [Caenorhabditis auriculariae]